MKIYFIRHGEYARSPDDQEPIKTSPLSEKGSNDVQKKALLLSTHEIDEIICSQLTRAKETAEIVAMQLNIPIRHNSNLDERVKGVEGFLELVKRGKALIDELESSSHNLLIVSHSEIMAIIFGLLVFKDKFTEEIHKSTKHFFYLNEAEVIAVEKRKVGWKLAEY